MHEEEHVRVNRDGWDRVADEYQQLQADQRPGAHRRHQLGAVGHP